MSGAERFFVGFSFKGTPAELLYEQLCAELAEHCGIPALSGTHPPHITVLPPPKAGTTSDINAVARALPAVACQEVMDTAIESFGQFSYDRGHAIYLRLINHPFLGDYVDYARDELAGVIGGPVEKPFTSTPHITLARHLSREQEVAARQYLLTREPIWCRISLKTLSIFRWDGAAYQEYLNLQLLPRHRGSRYK